MNGDEVVNIGPESGRTMLRRHMEENGWTEATLILLIADWLDLDDTRLVDLSRYLNDEADTQREADAEMEAMDDHTGLVQCPHCEVWLAPSEVVHLAADGSTVCELCVEEIAIEVRLAAQQKEDETDA